jgi:hypothetical protein
MSIISSGPGGRKKSGGTLLLWFARISSLFVVVLLAVMLSGENGSGPTGKEWAYLAFFPFGFCLGYLLAWKWPLVGGALSLLCMVASQFAIGRIYDMDAYMAWAMLSVPGVLFVIAGWKQRR